MGLFNFAKVKDEDLFIDFKLDLYSQRIDNKDPALFDLLTQYRRPGERTRDGLEKGKEHETMPYFLTDQFRAVL